MKRDDIARLRAASRYFALATLVMTLLLLVFMGAMLLEEGSDPANARTEMLVLHTAYLLPGLFYLWALLALRMTFRDIGRGATFEPAIARGLRQLGWALLGSGVASTFLVPLIAVPIIRRGMASGTIEPGRHSSQIDAAYLMLVLVGIAILLVARLFAMAADVRARNQALEAELGEFL